MRIPSGCAISGMLNTDGRLENGERIMRSIALMHERSNGLGGGFAAYGIYPEYRECYAFHLIFEDEDAKDQTEDYLTARYRIERGERIPTMKRPDAPITWRYFLAPDRPGEPDEVVETERMLQTVIAINDTIYGAYVMSSGRNMGVFKGVGYPEDIGRFYKLDRYKAYQWIAHGRFPTNTPGWWAGAHPFCLLDMTVVHNGEISSYGINKRYLEQHGYKLTLRTDTEAIACLVDLLTRKHGLSIEDLAHVLAPPFWKKIDRMGDERLRRLRIIYGDAMLNGPFSVIIGHGQGMIGLNDRIKLRPMTAARDDATLYIATEESAIREIADPDEVWYPRAGEAVIGTLTPDAEAEERDL